MCTPRISTPEPLPPPEPVEERRPDVEVTARRNRTKKRQSSGNTSRGLNRFLVVPGNSGSGANIPQ